MTRCAHDPRQYLGMPLGQYHCPGDARAACGCMVIAGLEHGPCDPECEQFDEADRAAWARMEQSLDSLEGSRGATEDSTTEETPRG